MKEELTSRGKKKKLIGMGRSKENAKPTLRLCNTGTTSTPPRIGDPDLLGLASTTCEGLAIKQNPYLEVTRQFKVPL